MRIELLFIFMLLHSSVLAQYFVFSDQKQEDHCKQKKECALIQRYLFLEEHMSPPSKDESGWKDKIRQFFYTGFTYGSATIIAHVVMKLIFFIPFIKKEFERVQLGYDFAQKAKVMYETTKSLPSDVMYLFQKGEDESVSLVDVMALLERKKKAIDEVHNFYNVSWAGIFYIVSLMMNYFVDNILAKKKWTFAQILTDYVKNWQEYRIFTPDEFQPFLEILYNIYTARSCLKIDESSSKEIVLSFVTHSVQHRQHLEYG